MRTGAYALSLLAVPINAAVLEALAEQPKSLLDLRREVDSPPQTTMRAYLRALTELGVLVRRRHDEFPGQVEYELTENGRELLVVAGVVASWLGRFPESPTGFGTGAARSALKALVGGWSTNMIRALAARPMSLTELDAVISSVSYPSLERRLGAMRHENLVEPLATQGRGTPYGASDWLRRAAAPLSVAARWERRRLREETPAITGRDAEAGFLLALPLVRLSARRSGSCRFGVRIEDGELSTVAGAVATFREGRAESCETQLETRADCWAVGSADAWFAAAIENDSSGLSFGGDAGFAREAIAELHAALFRR